MWFGDLSHVPIYCLKDRKGKKEEKKEEGGRERSEGGRERKSKLP